MISEYEDDASLTRADNDMELNIGDVRKPIANDKAVTTFDQ